jgi:hypothetical protein
LANVAQVDILRSINKKKKPPAAGTEFFVVRHKAAPAPDLFSFLLAC